MSEPIDEVFIPEHPRTILVESSSPLSVLLLFIALLLSSVAGYGLLKSGTDGSQDFPLAYVLLHLLACVLTWFAIFIGLGAEQESRQGWALFLGTFSFLAGPVGVLGSLVSYLMAKGQPTGTPLIEVVKSEMFVMAPTDEESDDFMSMDLKIRDEAQVEPIIDMLPLADISTAIAIVNRLRERGQRQDIELIRSVASDPRPEVYQYALAILDKMEKLFAAKVYALQEEIHENPERPSLRVEMAKLHLDYIQSGLLDESLREYYWELTLSHLFEAMLAYPQRVELGVDVAQLLALKGLSDEAGSVAMEVTKKDPSNLQAQFLIIQALYERALKENSSEGILSAKKVALGSAWAVRLPKKRAPGLGPTFDLAHFWFGDASDA